MQVRILPEIGLVYVRYSSWMSIDESGAAFAEYLAHPDFRLGQKQLIDLTEVTEWDRDFTKLLALQARKADVFHQPPHSTLLAMIAPTPKARTLANWVSRSWDQVDTVAYLVAETEAEALELLGIRAERIDELLPSP
ncbi:hypothetical protein [Sinisalibacter lacisalsi]|uniref:Uncharacterized protein n=1 Tax=Sinisalibacter lacisalsi TaxID=1526570 RepID=A0ABQ1QNK1_9RHOB|nr:hypothetical protein [Sinisalibacter lacisalsi]GGD34058.1 hypothetical protein GCM10011358_17630 [Sinisalibacter lacisalsi]